MERKSRLRFAVFALAGTAFFLSFFHRVAPAAISRELRSLFLATVLGSFFIPETHCRNVWRKGAPT